MTRSHVRWIAMLLASPALLTAQDAKKLAFRLTDAYVRRLATENTIMFEMVVRPKARTSTVHAAAKDCEIHLAATPAARVGYPNAVVVEPPSLCKEKLPGMKGVAEWPAVLDQRVMGKVCVAVGFPRLYTEHMAETGHEANPPHMVEIHPALELRCGQSVGNYTDVLDFRKFLEVVPGLGSIQESSTSTCLDKFQLWVRKVGANYEFSQSRPNVCGNFVKLAVAVDPSSVRPIKGGHTATTLAFAGEDGPYTLRIYTYDGTPEDKTVVAIGGGADDSEDLHLHGLMTYDFTAIVKALRNAQGRWLTVSQWTEIEEPLALVVFGTASP